MAQPTRQLVDELEQVRDELDTLIGSLRLGPRSHRQHDDAVDRVERMATILRAAVRGPASPTRPPLAVLADGRMAW